MVQAKKQGEYHWDKGDVSWSPAPRSKKKNNPILDPAEKILTNPKNKAPASTFIKRQKRLEQLMNEM